MKNNLWQSAFSPMSDVLGDQVYAALEHLEDGRMKRHNKRILLIAALIAVLLIAGVALAVGGGGRLLETLFPKNDAPDDAAIALQSIENSVTKANYTLTADEYLLTNSELYVNFDFHTDSDTEQMVAFCLEYENANYSTLPSANETSNFDIYRSYSSTVLMGGPGNITDYPDKMAAGVSQTPTEPFTARLTAIVMEPTCPVYDNECMGEVNSEDKLPAIQRCKVDDPYTHFEFLDNYLVLDEDFVPDDFFIGPSYDGVWVREFCIHNVMVKKVQAGMGRAEAYAQTVEELGYARVVEMVSLDLKIDSKTSSTRFVPKQTHYEFSDRTIDLMADNFNVASYQLGIKLSPKTPTDVDGGMKEISEWNGGVLYYQVQTDTGESFNVGMGTVPTDAAFIPGFLRYAPVGSSVLFGELIENGNGLQAHTLNFLAYLHPYEENWSFDSEIGYEGFDRRPEYDFTVDLVPAAAKDDT